MEVSTGSIKTFKKCSSIINRIFAASLCSQNVKKGNYIFLTKQINGLVNS